jgi:hypothetical protein
MDLYDEAGSEVPLPQNRKIKWDTLSLYSHPGILS